MSSTNKSVFVPRTSHGAQSMSILNFILTVVFVGNFKHLKKKLKFISAALGLHRVELKRMEGQMNKQRIKRAMTLSYIRT